MATVLEVDRGRAGVRGSLRLPAIALLVLLVAGFLGLALFYAAAQDLWVDESTQLSGIRLPLGRMLAWLAGAPEQLGVPADRMPPVSYLLDKACARTLCTSPFDLRVLHVVVATTGLALLLETVARRYGTLALAAAGLFLLLNSNLVNEVPELRAYPIFFAGAAWQVRLFCGLCDRPGLDPRRLAGLAVVSLLTIYVHFFGLVSSSALFLALIVGRARTRADLVRGLVAWGVVLVASAGLAPFVIGANEQSTGVASDGLHASELAWFLLRITSFPSLLIHMWTAQAFFAGLAVVLAALAWRLVPRTRGDAVRPWSPARGLLFALAAGLGVTILAGCVASGFEPLKPSYSIWVIPVVAALIGAACSPRGGSKGPRTLALAGTALLLLGAAGGQLVLVRHARWFTHGNVNEIVSRFTSDPSRVAVVYDGDYWGANFFPLWYLYGPRLRQWHIDAVGYPHRIGPMVQLGPAEQSVLAGGPVDQVIFASVQVATYRELRLLAHGRVPVDLAQPLDRSPGWLGEGWTAGNEIRTPGDYWLRLISFHRSSGR